MRRTRWMPPLTAFAGDSVQPRSPERCCSAATRVCRCHSFPTDVRTMSISTRPVRRTCRAQREVRLHKTRGDSTMRFMVLLKANKDTEGGVLPSEQLLADMTRYNEELVKAGVMLAGEGLQPSSKGARVKFSGSKRTVVDGPFAETKELIAGFWILQTRSKEEAVEWVKRCPNPTGEDAEIEIRQIFEAADFGEAFTPELQEREARVGEQMADNAKR